MASALYSKETCLAEFQQQRMVHWALAATSLTLLGFVSYSVALMVGLVSLFLMWDSWQSESFLDDMSTKQDAMEQFFSPNFSPEKAKPFLPDSLLSNVELKDLQHPRTTSDEVSYGALFHHSRANLAKTVAARSAPYVALFPMIKNEITDKVHRLRMT